MPSQPAANVTVLRILARSYPWLDGFRPRRIEGLFSLTDGRRSGIDFQWEPLPVWLLDDGPTIPDDALTGVALYSFSDETFKRVFIHRPSPRGMEFIRKGKLNPRVVRLKPQRWAREFGITKEWEDTWNAFVSRRQLWLREIGF